MKGIDCMRFIDNYSDMEYSIKDLFNDYKTFKLEEPYNHCENFKTELLEIMLASINGRNDFDIIGLTSNEIEKIILKLRV